MANVSAGGFVTGNVPPPATFANDSSLNSTSTSVPLSSQRDPCKRIVNVVVVRSGPLLTISMVNVPVWAAGLGDLRFAAPAANGLESDR